ncbi:hypothetical protein JEODO184_00967 [Jeotgalicoccus meleagridis]|uniref:Transposase DDE domain-containing protein n=1 Tax=Jeotgalicoccus meleagridis TaxID=2759181 RepID=A0A6V7RH95_9STAP|nr:hypothetical protein JEODO184_00967 [Jeotgalicoccus meleagridis]
MSFGIQRIHGHWIRFSIQCSTRSNTYQNILSQMLDMAVNPIMSVSSINMNLAYFKAQVKQTLSSPDGRHRYAQRKIDVETTFGNLKANLGFTRMSVRGHQSVRNELGIALMAVNLRKLARHSVGILLKLTKTGFGILKSRFQTQFYYFFRAFVPAPFFKYDIYRNTLPIIKPSAVDANEKNILDKEYLKNSLVFFSFNKLNWSKANCE